MSSDIFENINLRFVLCSRRLENYNLIHRKRYIQTPGLRNTTRAIKITVVCVQTRALATGALRMNNPVVLLIVPLRVNIIHD